MAGSSHGDASGAGCAASISSKVIFGKARVSPPNAASGGSSHGDGSAVASRGASAGGSGAGGVGGADSAAIRSISSNDIFGNARVSPLNSSAGGGAPNGESLS